MVNVVSVKTAMIAQQILINVLVKTILDSIKMINAHPVKIPIARSVGITIKIVILAAMDSILIDRVHV